MVKCGPKCGISCNFYYLVITWIKEVCFHCLTLINETFKEIRKLVSKNNFLK